MKTQYIWCAILFVGMAAVLAVAEATTASTVWTYRTDSGHIAGSPAAGDVNGDGIDELAVTDTGGNITVLSGNGQPLWTRHVPGPITIAPTLADVCPGGTDTGDSRLELLAVNGDGRIYCLDANSGRRIWVYTLPHTVDWGRTSISVNDLDHDGSPEIITGASSGSVVCLSGEGDELWVYSGGHGHTLCPASGDLDGDGMCETLIAGSASALTCLSHEGKELWRLGDGMCGASPVVWNLDSDARPEVVAGIGNELVVVNGDGTVRWTYAMQKEMDSAISVADADADGVPEIYAVDLSGFVASLSPDGRLRWSGSVGQRARRSPSIADVDGDGVAEILVAGYSAAIHVFTPDGTLGEQIALPGASNATATVMKIGSGEANTWRAGVVCPTQDGSMGAFQWPTATDKAIAPWPEYRLNAARTASQPGEPTPETPRIFCVDLGTEGHKHNEYRVHVDNPERRRLTVLLDVQMDGKPLKERSRSSRDERIECSLPYRIVGQDAARLTFTCTVMEGETLVARQRNQAYTRPYAREIAEAEQRLADLGHRIPQLADPSEAERRLSSLRTALQRDRAQSESRGALSVRERGALEETLETALAAAKALSAQVEGALATTSTSQGSLLICAANPWAPFGGLDEAAEGRTPPAQLTVEAFDGEIECAALNLFNFGGKARTLRVELGPISESTAASPDKAAPVGASEVVSLHEVIEVPTLVLEYPSSDALPLLNQAMTITVPAWSGRQLWLNVNTASLAPGRWSTAVRLRTLEAAPVELTAGLDIAVWNASLPQEQPLRLCHWAHVEGSYLKDHPEAALKDQVAHGTNVFVSSFPPVAAFNEHGELVGAIDFAAHDAYVRRHAPHGIILFGGYQGGLQGPGGLEGPAYEKAYGPWLRAWVEHLKELGVGYDGFALYPIDEIGLYPGLVQSYLRFARLTREADPNVLMYTDPTTGVTDEEFKELVPYVDIWCPNSSGYLFDRNHDKLEFMKATGNTVWTYECFGVAKHQNPLAYYRGQAWHAWHHGLTGIGFWTYCTSNDDPWFAPRANNEYTMVYGGNGVVSSKRWEAVRDGIEDYSMLSLLRNAVKTDEVQQKHPDAVGEAERVLGARASAIGEYTRFEEWDAKPGPEGLTSRRRESDEQWRSYQTIRADIARLLTTMTKPE
ncbi:MAG: PQQ-binding-like beta-propeller repeat protein [Candidatus Hydrogenedentes bacterium]|nr:PQQ-binding-like beta-propeller repeat protein [Candidatus Hydrogenedentota bacterium]